MSPFALFNWCSMFSFISPFHPSLFNYCLFFQCTPSLFESSVHSLAIHFGVFSPVVSGRPIVVLHCFLSIFVRCPPIAQPYMPVSDQRPPLSIEQLRTLISSLPFHYTTVSDDARSIEQQLCTMHTNAYVWLLRLLVEQTNFAANP